MASKATAGLSGDSHGHSLIRAELDPAQPDLEPDWVDRVRSRLISWYVHAARDLPWRTNRDPYRILVSEMMLVQTTVAAVVPFFDRFLQQFPDLPSLASADDEVVLKAWEGLGYYRRARQLHAAAKQVVALHGGVFPNDPEAVRSLPGVGRYIAGAILSFAFDRPAPIVEANTQRVLARWLAWPGDLTAKETQARLWLAAERMVPPQGAGVFNQAFMELGALICTPRSPSCLVCPVASACRARALGLQDTLPIVAPRPAPLKVREACALVSRKRRVLIVKRGPNRLWEGFWEFPTIHLEGVDPAGRSFREDQPIALAEGVRRLTGIRVEVGSLARTVTFAVTKHRVRLDAFEARGLDEALVPGQGMIDAAWVEPSALSSQSFSSAGRQLSRWLVGRGGVDD